MLPGELSCQLSLYLCLSAFLVNLFLEDILLDEACEISSQGQPISGLMLLSGYFYVPLKYLAKFKCLRLMDLIKLDPG